MTALAAIRAEYTDWKLIRTRSTVQIIFEIPVARSSEAFDCLGGMPDPSKSIWCAIARLKEGDETGQQAQAAPSEAEPHPPTPSSAQPRSWRDLSYPQQAGIRCSEEAFRKFLSEKIAPDADFDSCCTTPAATELAASIVRTYCLVQSRGDIRPNHPSARLWRELEDKFQTWMHHPEFA